MSWYLEAAASVLSGTKKQKNFLLETQKNKSAFVEATKKRPRNF
jgi:hypothetical protein